MQSGSCALEPPSTPCASADADQTPHSGRSAGTSETLQTQPCHLTDSGPSTSAACLRQLFLERSGPLSSGGNARSVYPILHTLAPLKTSLGHSQHQRRSQVSAIPLSDSVRSIALPSRTNEMSAPFRRNRGIERGRGRQEHGIQSESRTVFMPHQSVAVTYLTVSYAPALNDARIDLFASSTADIVVDSIGCGMSSLLKLRDDSDVQMPRFEGIERHPWLTLPDDLEDSGSLDVAHIVSSSVHMILQSK